MCVLQVPLNVYFGLQTFCISAFVLLLLLSVRVPAFSGISRSAPNARGSSNSSANDQQSSGNSLNQNQESTWRDEDYDNMHMNSPPHTEEEDGNDQTGDHSTR